MHVLFVHQNFPAQFGPIARALVRKNGWQCTFVSQAPPGITDGIENIRYAITGGATRQTHFCSRTFENGVWHCDAIHDALKARPDIRPDLIVGHSGFGTTLFLRELYPKTPIVNLFEFFYHPHGPDSDMDFRRDLGWDLPQEKYFRAYCRNAMILLDLQNCHAGYCPTDFQRQCFPRQYTPKLRTIFDGIDREVFQSHGDSLRPPPAARSPRRIAGIDVPPQARVVTYVSRGFESMRGFDIFMRSTRIIAREVPEAVFIVIGSDRIVYGGDEQFLDGRTFKEWVLSRDDYDLSRYHFVGRLSEADLAVALASTDLHMYLTVPFVVSWSMMDALSCGAVVLGSSTSPVKEMIRDGHNGLLADFFSPEEFARKAVAVLRDPAAFRPLGRAAELLIQNRYSIDAVLPQMAKLYEQSAAGVPPTEAEAQPVSAVAAVDPQEVILSVRPPARRSPFRG
jgi:glycosyltransferase involved in cell wall biosynthesis